MVLATGLNAPVQPRDSSQGRPASYALDSFNFQHGNLIDCVCIVRAIGKSHLPRPSGTMATGVEKDFIRDISIEKGVVVDGSLPKGQTVSLVAFDPPDDLPIGYTGPRGGSGIKVVRRPSFVVGQRYLVLGLKAVDGKLYQASNLSEPRFLKEGMFIESRAPNEVSLLTAFPTNESQLMVTKDPSERLINALVDALPAVHGWDRDRLNYFLDISGGFGYDKYDPHPDSPLTEKLRSIARTTSDKTLRVDAYSVLVNWCVLGSEGPFFTALMDVANDTSFERELPVNPLFVRPGMIGEPKFGYRIEYDTQRCNDLAATARNGDVRRFLFEFGIQNPTKASLSTYVRMLDTEPKEFVDRVMLRKLARLANIPDKMPVFGVPPGKVMQECINRQELVTFWKSKYGLPPP